MLPAGSKSMAAVVGSPSTGSSGAPVTAGGDGTAQGQKRKTHVMIVVFMYALSSLGAVFVNKATLSAFKFHNTITLMLSQLIVSAVAMSCLRFFRVLVIPKRSLRELMVLVYPAVFLIANVTVGLIALRLVNIPMFSAFRRLSVLNVMLLEWWVLGRTATRRIFLTVFIMVLGSFLAGLGDLTFDAVGYSLVFLNNFITGANLVSIKRASNIVRLGALPLNYYITLFALPIVFVLAVVTGDLKSAIHEISTRQELQTVGFAIALSLSAASAFMVNFFTYLCTQRTSPLTTAITGQMKNVLQTILGIFAWGYKVSALNLAGLAVALTGSLWFAYFKYDDSKAARGMNAPAGGGGYTPVKTEDEDEKGDDSQLKNSNSRHHQEDDSKGNMIDAARGDAESSRMDLDMADAAIRMPSTMGSSSVMLSLLDQDRDSVPMQRQLRR